MEKVKVAIAVEGGSVSAVHAGSFVDVVIVDFDNLKAEGKTSAQCERIWNKAKGDIPSQW